MQALLHMQAGLANVVYMSFYRLQDPAHLDTLTQPGQLSYSYKTYEPRNGKSVCDTPEELADYLATSGVQFTGDWVLVELDGDYSEDDDEDADLGVTLIHPTKIIQVTPFDTFLTDYLSPAFDRIEAEA